MHPSAMRHAHLAYETSSPAAVTHVSPRLAMGNENMSHSIKNETRGRVICIPQTYLWTSPARTETRRKRTHNQLKIFNSLSSKRNFDERTYFPPLPSSENGPSCAATYVLRAGAHHHFNTFAAAGQSVTSTTPPSPDRQDASSLLGKLDDSTLSFKSLEIPCIVLA